MTGRSLFAGIAALATFLAVSVSALAWPGILEGQPTLTPSSPVGYYVWHNDSGFHLRTHGPGDAHYFVAVLRTDGVFENIDTIRLESRDKYAVLDGGHTLVLRFHTYNYTDGVNFTIRSGERLRFSLELDGSLISTNSIYLGAHGVHPRSNPFTIYR